MYQFLYAKFFHKPVQAHHELGLQNIVHHSCFVEIDIAE